jgi:hypothetical protein
MLDKLPPPRLSPAQVTATQKRARSRKIRGVILHASQMRLPNRHRVITSVIALLYWQAARSKLLNKALDTVDVPPVVDAILADVAGAFIVGAYGDV